LKMVNNNGQVLWIIFAPTGLIHIAMGLMDIYKALWVAVNTGMLIT
jgi:hypothetical protein